MTDKQSSILVATVSSVIVAVVAFLIYKSQGTTEYDESIYILPKLNAVINSSTFLLLILGYVFIRRRNIMAHKAVMISCLVLSVMFLVCYIIYHYSAPHTSFGGEGMIKIIYLFILFSHIALAIVVVPMALFTVLNILRNKVDKHKKIARITLPIWLYVSLTGVIVYLMIAPYYPV